MKRRTLLAFTIAGMGLSAGCSGPFGAEEETAQEETAVPTPTATDSGEGTSAEETREETAQQTQTETATAPTFDRIALAPTDNQAEVAYSIQATDTDSITSLEITSPSGSETRTFGNRVSIEASGTVEAPPGQQSPITVTLTNQAGETNSNEQRSYARRYSVLEETEYDIGTVYHPAYGGEWGECIAGTPSVGEYGVPPEDEIVAQQVDQAQGFGINRWLVPYNEIEQLRQISGSPLAHQFDFELLYNPRPALTGETSLGSELAAIRQVIASTPEYATRDGRPVVTVGTGPRTLIDFDESHGGFIPDPVITSEFGSPEEFVETLREELRLDDGTPPYLLVKLGGVVDQETYLTEEYRRFAAQFDAMFEKPAALGRGSVPWEDAFTRNLKRMLYEWRLARILSIDFEPTVIPGLDPEMNECNEWESYIPRSPEHLAELLHVAKVFSTTGRIRLESFNDWHTGTQVEPGRGRDGSYGTAYLDTIRSFQSSGRENRSVHYVSTDGVNSNPGSERKPVRSIQHALGLADPGDTVHVLPGEYHEFVETVRDGEPGQPITITGPPDAVLKSNEQDHPIVRFRHSHVHLTGLTLDGLVNPEAPEDADSYSRGVVARPFTTTDAFLEDLVIAPHGIGNTSGEMVSIERTQNAEVGPFRVIGPSGAKVYRTDEPGHNAEIVYLGTSPSNLGTVPHPWEEYDRTNDILVHHIDNSEGYDHSELVQMKPGTHDVTIEYCTDGGGSNNTEARDSASIRLNSYAGTVRWCNLRDGEGDGIDIGSSLAKDARENKTDLTEFERRGGTDNAVYGNRITGYDDKAIVFGVNGQTQSDQRVVCNNEYDGDTDGDPGGTCPESVPDGDGIGHTGGDSPWS